MISSNFRLFISSLSNDHSEQRRLAFAVSRLIKSRIVYLYIFGPFLLFLPHLPTPKLILWRRLAKILFDQQLDSYVGLPSSEKILSTIVNTHAYTNSITSLKRNRTGLFQRGFNYDIFRLILKVPNLVDF